MFQKLYDLEAMHNEKKLMKLKSGTMIFADILWIYMCKLN